MPTTGLPFTSDQAKCWLSMSYPSPRHILTQETLEKPGALQGLKNYLITPDACLTLIKQAERELSERILAGLNR